MLKHLPSIVFALAMVALILNSAGDSNPLVMAAALVVGIAAMGVIVFLEKREKGPGPSREEEIERLRREQDSLRRSLEGAQAGDEKIDFLKSQLAQTERDLAKLEKRR